MGVGIKQEVGGVTQPEINKNLVETAIFINY